MLLDAKAQRHRTDASENGQTAQTPAHATKEHRIDEMRATRRLEPTFK